MALLALSFEKPATTSPSIFRERGREGGREREREGGREGRREGGREGGREGERGREGGREGREREERERDRQRVRRKVSYTSSHKGNIHTYPHNNKRVTNSNCTYIHVYIHNVHCRYRSTEYGPIVHDHSTRQIKTHTNNK